MAGAMTGMRDSQRAMRFGWAATRMAIIWTSAAGAVLALYPRTFIGIFTNDQSIITAGVGALIVIGLAQLAQAVNFTLGGALRGSGETRFTLVTTVVNWFVVRLPLAVLFAFPLGLGLAGIWLAILVDYCVRAVILSPCGSEVGDGRGGSCDPLIGAQGGN
ncbi:MAG TPA: MATE family efflux transporter [Candidatus Limnocylindria bacterium]|nr:MATE family efflux transporter [Candidatus Limnocylindria bacterium]